MSLAPATLGSYDVYIGRGRDPRDGATGCWASPFSAGDQDPAGGETAQGRREGVARYADWLAFEVDAERVSLEQLAALDGKTLGCDCLPGPCHGEVLERAAAWAAAMLAGGPNIFWELRPSKRGGYFG